MTLVSGLICVSLSSGGQIHCSLVGFVKMTDRVCAETCVWCPTCSVPACRTVTAVQPLSGQLLSARFPVRQLNHVLI